MQIGSGARRKKMIHKVKKRKDMSCLEVLDVLFRGLKSSPDAWASFKEV
jgi:hypothetical protein